MTTVTDVVAQETSSKVLDSENTTPHPRCILGGASTPDRTTLQVLTPEPFDPECFLISLNFLEWTEHTGVITTIRGSFDTKTSLFLRVADILPRLEDALPPPCTEPEEPKQ